MRILKSIGAVVAGLVAIFAVTHATDFGLEKSGLMKIPFHENPVWFMVLVTMYRLVYSVAGCFLTATLAPDHPMRHAIILGIIGVLLSSLGAVVMWDQPPRWYPLTLVVFALPCAWLGGRLKTRK